jgi:flagellar biosynthesis/type III secretory pathway chaperone
MEQKSVQIAEKQDELAKIMYREVSILREILGNMREEQHTLLNNKADHLKSVLEQREQLLHNMVSARNQRTGKVHEIATLTDKLQEGDLLSVVLDPADPSSLELLSLRDQLLALLGQLNDQNTRNNYLLQNKIEFNKELIQRLSPKEENPTYSRKGALDAQNKKTLLTLINREV